MNSAPAATAYMSIAIDGYILLRFFSLHKSVMTNNDIFPVWNAIKHKPHRPNVPLSVNDLYWKINDSFSKLKSNLDEPIYFC